MEEPGVSLQDSPGGRFNRMDSSLRPSLSVIVPAYNESRCIGRALEILMQSLEESDLPAWEVIVADDESTDDTALIARNLGARVITSGKRNIGGTRNVGASVATGDYVLFVDADTLVRPGTIRDLVAAMDTGVLGGGARIAWSEPGPFWADIGVALWNRYAAWTKSPAGSFFFVKREAFQAVGGFDEEYFATEELHLGRKLKRLGKLTILPTPVETSPRKVQDYTVWDHLRIIGRMIRSPRKGFMNPEGLEIWYTRKG